MDQSALAGSGEVWHPVRDRVEYFGAYRLSDLSQSGFGQSRIQQVAGAAVVLEIAHETVSCTDVPAPVPLQERKGERGLKDAASARIADCAVGSDLVE
ncbi:hypothetical protein [Streptomyces sp. NL15-2K]|uniref:hypothetical protein n=1 Tax=Streptomyces sp. NL15-2K TaxID=376149 RepID=UPI00155A946E|nr:MULTISPECIES: hypothetical protein [Actinomycetes]WKX06006.1 hypothetical protein Q4V64_00245 [Kutzneria buriramensis]